MIDLNLFYPEHFLLHQYIRDDYLDALPLHSPVGVGVVWVFTLVRKKLAGSDSGFLLFQGENRIK
ncbi:hypothetical protein OO184_24380 [Photorhabdus sp. APURE]|uniref:hypothetical protein n=1 Tax=Photorhabdus aballayi TaxID=2991723 RepID=UPI00223E0787|nr:hypothetical protein [Photorhabdus aballayi]MCW7550978.1 hypothetical protein [Photorhabdus aballayi]